MTHENASYDPPLIDWTRPRWMADEPQIEDARKLERGQRRNRALAIEMIEWALVNARA